MSFAFVFERMSELFIIMAIGYVSCRCGMIDRDMRAKISSLVLNLSMPAMMLGSVLNAESLPPLDSILQLLTASLLSYAVLAAVALPAPWLLALPKGQRGATRFALLFGNIAFIGYPVTRAMFGDAAVFYTTVFIMPFYPLAYSLGVAIIRGRGDGAQGASGRLREVLMTPCLIAAVLTLILSLTRWRGPAILGRTCAMLGGITSPAALLVIGSSLAGMRAMDIFKNLRVYLLSAVKLLAAPLATCLAFRPFVSDPMLLGVATVLAGMPPATLASKRQLHSWALARAQSSGPWASMSSLFDVQKLIPFSSAALA